MNKCTLGVCNHVIMFPVEMLTTCLDRTREIAQMIL